MRDINSLPTIMVNESLTKRVSEIIAAAKEYDLEEEVKKHIIINKSDSGDRIGYALEVPKIFFKEYPEFFMKL